MKKVVSAAHLDAATASKKDICHACPLSQAFNLIVGFDPNDKTYYGFSEKSNIHKFDETGQEIAALFDQARREDDDVMLALRELLPLEVELYDY
jgi:hypothetical protein